MGRGRPVALRPEVENALPVPAMSRMSRYFLILALAWVAAMTWRLYPQFKDAVRVDGRLTTVEDYIDDSCGQRVGPAAATCFAESREQAQRLLRREQGRSVLLIEAPVLGYLLLFLTVALWRGLRRDVVPG
jgi:hypothetical protein